MNEIDNAMIVFGVCRLNFILRHATIYLLQPVDVRG